MWFHSKVRGEKKILKMITQFLQKKEDLLKIS